MALFTKFKSYLGSVQRSSFILFDKFLPFGIVNNSQLFSTRIRVSFFLFSIFLASLFIIRDNRFLLFLSFLILRFSSIEFSRERRDMIVLSKARAFPSIPASTACNAIAGLVASGLRVRPLFHNPIYQIRMGSGLSQNNSENCLLQRKYNKGILSKLISVVKITEVHHNDNVRDDTVVSDDVNLFVFN